MELSDWDLQTARSVVSKYCMKSEDDLKPSHEEFQTALLILIFESIRNLGTRIG